VGGKVARPCLYRQVEPLNKKDLYEKKRRPAPRTKGGGVRRGQRPKTEMLAPRVKNRGRGRKKASVKER